MFFIAPYHIQCSKCFTLSYTSPLLIQTNYKLERMNNQKGLIKEMNKNIIFFFFFFTQDRTQMLEITHTHTPQTTT